MNAKESMERFYAGENEEARLLSRHGQVECRTTMRFIERYLQTGMRVADIGAGTGRYALALAGKAAPWTRWNWWKATFLACGKTRGAEKSIRAFPGRCDSAGFFAQRRV